MNVTAGERRRILKLFNVSETARQIGVPVPEMHRWISAGYLPMPTVRLGKRRYFTLDDLAVLTRTCAEKKNHP